MQSCSPQPLLLSVRSMINQRQCHLFFPKIYELRAIGIDLPRRHRSSPSSSFYRSRCPLWPRAYDALCCAEAGVRLQREACWVLEVLDSGMSWNFRVSVCRRRQLPSLAPRGWVSSVLSQFGEPLCTLCDEKMAVEISRCGFRVLCQSSMT